MKKKIAAALSVMILSAANFDCVAPKNFTEILSTKVVAAQNTDLRFSFGGISFGMTFDEVHSIFGDPVGQIGDDEFVFSNGLIIEFKKQDNTVEKVEIFRDITPTDAGISVGMTAKKLFAVYGIADKVERDDGKIEYTYFSSNGRYKIEFNVLNGTIDSIESKIID